MQSQHVRGQGQLLHEKLELVPAGPVENKGAQAIPAMPQGRAIISPGQDNAAKFSNAVPGSDPDTQACLLLS